MLAVNCLRAVCAGHLRCLHLSARRFGSGGSGKGQGARTKEAATLKKSYRTLGVSEDCEDETLRLAFVNLAKQFHPDSGSRDADTTRFLEIEAAYRTVQKERSIQREREANLSPDVEEYDIKHTAPQHRHYLQYDTGTGTPSARQRRHTAERAQRAAENVMEHRLTKIQAAERNTLMGMDKSRAKDVKTRYGIDRLVEDLIQEAMNKGEFSDLPGAGKPLRDNSSSQNPYVDFVTHKMNQLLIDNGFTPEWIQLSKEIREDTRNVEDRLSKAREKLGPMPLSPEDSQSWAETLEQMADSVKRINSQIDKYNLLVPILQNQMLQIDLKVIAGRILEKPVEIGKRNITERETSNPIEPDQQTFLGTLLYGFSWNKEK